MADSDTVDDHGGIESDEELVQRLRVDFRRRLNRGEKPLIEEYLAAVADGPCGDRVLRELLRLEIDYLRQRGDFPRPDDYQRRFHDRDDVVLKVFASLAETKESVGGTRVENAPESPADERRTSGRDTTTLGRFQLLERVGVGAYGAVWKASDQKLDRVVAVKLPRYGNLDAVGKTRFLHEARTAAKLSHPNIVGVHDVGEHDGQLYIVSEFVEGTTLAKYLASRRLAPREAARLCFTLAEALHYAHEHGVVHRDLKPGNVMMTMDDEPRIMDFGLAKLDSTESTIAFEGAVLGTPAYMAPEQARGESHHADRRTDIYALGVILYQLLTGDVPFHGNPTILTTRILRDLPKSPRLFDRRIPEDLETICLKCLEKQPGKRFSTAGELADELKRYLTEEPIRSRPVGMLGRAWRWYLRNPDAPRLTAGGFGVVTSIILLCWGIWGAILVSLDLLPTNEPNRALLELVVIITVVYVPMLLAGLRTLNHRGMALWIGALFTAMYSGMLAVALVDPDSIVMQLETWGEARNNPGVRLQWVSLLLFMTSVGFIAHVAALLGRILLGRGAAN